MFKNDDIEGVIIRPLEMFQDPRGWLSELFRADELPSGFAPAMSYISATLPGITRGPHEHVEQTDFFCFVGPSNFKVALWDDRKDSSTYRNRMAAHVGERNPSQVIVPPGVVHAYKNVGDIPGWVMNFPDRLYKGPGKKEVVDEIRHEDNPRSGFAIDDF